MSKHSTAVRRNIRRRKRHRLAIGLNATVAVLLAAVLLGMVNYLSYRRYARWDWSRTGYYTLSDKTLGLLSTLTNPVEVVDFLTPESEAYEDTRNLLREYEYASPLIKVSFVDPHRDMARAEQYARRFDVNQLDADVVVFSANGRNKFVRDSEINERDFSMANFQDGPQKVAFRGELVFSSAIQSVVQDEKPVVYFLTGHGERAIDNFDPLEGYSAAAKAIEHDNVLVKTLNLAEAHAIPDDADALVIAGPTKKIAEPELKILARYLQENGRLMLLLDAAVDSGLTPLLKAWGVRLDNDVVVDGSRTISGRELLVNDYGVHPITRGLNGIISVFYFPRSVSPVEEAEGDPADRPHVTVLARSSPAGWAETDLDSNPMKFDPAFDQPGPVGVAAAVERGPGKSIDVEIRPTRLVVVGDSDFVTNGAASGGNMDLFLGSLNWLLEREALMAIAPRPVEMLRLMLSHTQLNLLFALVVVGLPLAVAVLGLAVWIRRRS